MIKRFANNIVDTGTKIDNSVLFYTFETQPIFSVLKIQHKPLYNNLNYKNTLKIGIFSSHYLVDKDVHNSLILVTRTCAHWISSKINNLEKKMFVFMQHFLCNWPMASGHCTFEIVCTREGTFNCWALQDSGGGLVESKLLLYFCRIKWAQDRISLNITDPCSTSPVSQRLSHSPGLWTTAWRDHFRIDR